MPASDCAEAAISCVEAEVCWVDAETCSAEADDCSATPATSPTLLSARARLGADLLDRAGDLGDPAADVLDGAVDLLEGVAGTAHRVDALLRALGARGDDPTTRVVSVWISPISCAICAAAAWDSSASLRTSSATTAKPRWLCSHRRGRPRWRR